MFTDKVDPAQMAGGRLPAGRRSSLEGAGAARAGCREIEKIWRGSEDIAISDRSLIWNTDLIEALEYDNLISQAAVTVFSAENRKESRGAHAREDFSERDDESWMKHTLAWAEDASCKVNIDYRPVHTYTMTNAMAYIEPKARVY